MSPAPQAPATSLSPTTTIDAAALAAFSAGSLVENAAVVDVDVTALPAVEFYRCRFERCRMADASTARVRFEDCEFVACDLTKLRFGDASLRNVRFVDCKLVGVDFAAAADNPDVAFQGCLMRYARFDGVALRGCVFRACQLIEASFTETMLDDATFDDCDLTNAVFKNANLGGADFSTSIGVFFGLSNNRVQDAFISVDTAIHLARAAGLRVAGTDDKRDARKRRR
jgi:uncharacterized protein YjbI with pentapeptide repeats